MGSLGSWGRHTFLQGLLRGHALFARPRQSTSVGKELEGTNLTGPRLIDPYLQLKHQDIGLFVSRERSSGSTHLTPLQLLSLRQPFPSSESLLAENLLCFRRNPLVRGLCRKSPRLITPNLSADISHFVPVARSLSVKCQMS